MDFRDKSYYRTKRKKAICRNLRTISAYGMEDFARVNGFYSKNRYSPVGKDPSSNFKETYSCMKRIIAADAALKDYFNGDNYPELSLDMSADYNTETNFNCENIAS